MKNKLHKSNTEKMLFGVCGGLAELLEANNINIDVSVIRIIWALLAFFYGAGVLVYFVFAFVLPYDEE